MGKGARIRRLFLLCFAGAVALAIVLFTISIMFYYLLLYPPFQQRALRFAEAEMNKFFLGEISIERVESNLLSRIDFYGMRATGSAEYGDSVTVKHVTVHYWLPSLFKKRVNVRRLHLTDVRGHVVMAPGNDILLPFLPAFLKDPDNSKNNSEHKEDGEKVDGGVPNPSDWPVKFLIGKAKVDGINAVYRDLSNHMVGEIKNAVATADFHKLDSFSVDLKVPDGSYRSPWWDGTIDTLGASGVITWKDLYVHSMLLEGSGTKVTGGGMLSYMPNDPWNLYANFTTAIDPVPVLYAYDKDVGKEGLFEGIASFKGTLNHPILSARVKGSGLRYRGHEVKTLNVDADYGRDEYGRAKIKGVSPVGLFDVNAALLMKSLTRGEVEFGNYSLSANLTEFDARTVSKEFSLGDLAGAKSANMTLNASGSGINIPAFVDLSALIRGTAFGDAIKMGAVLSNDIWSVNGSVGYNRFEGSGRVNLQNGAVKGYLSARLPQPSAFTHTFAGEYVDGLIVAHADISGSVHNLDVTASLKGNDVKWRGMRSDSADVLLTVNGGVFDIKRADAAVAGELDSLFTFLKLDFPLTGEVEAQLTMSEGLRSPFINASVSGRNVRYGGIGADTAFGLALIRGDTVFWNSVELREKSSRALSSGRVILGQDLQIDAAAELFVENDTAKKASAKTSKKVSKKTAKKSSKMSAGWFEAKGVISGDSVKADYKLKSAQLAFFEPWIPPEHRVTGVFTSSGDIAGTISNPDAKVKYTVSNPRYGEFEARLINGSASLSDSLLSAQAQLRLNDNTEVVDFTALLPFLPASNWAIDESGERIAVIKSSAKEFDIGVIAAILGPQYAVRGRAAFEVQLSNAGSGWDVGGKVSLPDADIKYLPLKIHAQKVNFNATAAISSGYYDASFILNSGSIDMPSVHIENSVIRGHSNADTLVIDEAYLWMNNEAYINLAARIPYRGFDSLLYNRNVEAKYVIKDFPAQFFSTFLPQYGLRGGVFNGKGDIYTAVGRPFVNGDLALKGLELTIPDIYPSIGPVDAQLRFIDSTMRVVRASSKWGRGTIRAHGRAHWDMSRIYDIDLNLMANRLAFELPGVVQVGIETADLHLSDEGKNFVIGGRVSLAPSHYVRDLSIMEMIENMQIGAHVRRVPNPMLQSVLFRIDLDLANNMNVNMNMGNLLADGRISLMGNAAEPGFVGEVKVVDGFVYYLDRKFNISEGTLFNADPAVINPTLNIVAEADVSTYSPLERGELFTITLNVTGTMQSPIVRFSAEPELSELDILSVLTVGQRMGSVGSDINDRLANIAAQQAIGFGTRRLERILPVDRVSVSGDVFGSTDPKGATLSVTKRVTSRLLLTGETFMGKLSGKVTAHYRLTPYLYLEGQTTSDGEGAMDFIFRYSR